MVIVENRRRASFGTGWRNDGVEHPVLSEATVKIRVGEDVFLEAAEGNGPVDALYRGLSKAISDKFPEVDSVNLTDYKVRVVNEDDGNWSVGTSFDRIRGRRPVFGQPSALRPTSSTRVGWRSRIQRSGG